ncbi:hypothetical protein L1987_74532 [Smallanthus sonchifolius]|uniref:Uncharacterized protein n=1 Tax=Smallanthus sonchifolius TaxID=185202 RepID=A0ACB9A315_9ASTR|nr:hypothetical protein L1987_74532 [Smallanthus sonchifolius]
MAVHSLSSLPPLPIHPKLSLPIHPKLSNSANIDSFSSIRALRKTVTVRCVRNHTVTATMSVDAYAVGEDLPADYADWLPKADLRDRRRAGVLLHPTSFSGPYGIGDLGDQAFQFIDWLHEAGCSVWQVCILLNDLYFCNAYSDLIAVDFMTNDISFYWFEKKLLSVFNFRTLESEMQ